MALSVIGRPYGNYNSGLDFHGGAYAVAKGDLATAGFYQFDENSPGRVVAQVSSFGAGFVTLSSPMSDAQISMLHQGMYIATNVIDPTIVVQKEKLLNP